MGNTPSNNLRRPPGLTLDSFVSELGTDVLYEKSLGSSRFLKTIRARHKCGRIVIKVYVKTDPSLTLKSFLKRLKVERELLRDIPNVLNYQKSVETEKAGYLIRQWLTNNLYDRISTRPFLTLVEKKWIAFQLLNGMCDSWQRGVPHGDIKSENVIVTSWNWAYITDFSTAFKPTYLPEDDPADFSYYFDTSSRRSCYVAPERFYPSNHDMGSTSGSAVLESMDVFSLGCVIGEMFMEGASPFTLSQMFNYKSGEYSVEPYLRGIPDENIRNLVRSMIQLKPENRLSFHRYLRDSRINQTFPNSFYIFLHPFLFSLQELSGTASLPTARNPQDYGSASCGRVAENSSGVLEVPPHVVLRNDSDAIIEKLWSDFDYIARYICTTPSPALSSKSGQAPRKDMAGSKDVHQADGTGLQMRKTSCAVFPLQSHLPGHHLSLRVTPDPGKGLTDDHVALIILSVLSSNIRNCIFPSSIIKGLDLYLGLINHLSDGTILDRVLPYLVSLLNINDSNVNCDLVKSRALFCLTQVLLLVHTIAPSNSSLFSEYLIPNLRHFVNSPSELIRSSLGKCIGPLSLTAKRFLSLVQGMNQERRYDGDQVSLAVGESDDVLESSYDYNLNELQQQFQEELVTPLLTDSSPITKRSLLTSLPDLSYFFGRSKTNDILLSHILTYLNENDWILRTAFFEYMVEIIKETGPVSVEEYVLPLMVQALADSEEFVSVRVITALIQLIKKGLLSKPRLWELIAAVIVLLSHPNSWIRRASAELVCVVSKVLPMTDTWCVLYPALRKLLRCDIEELDEQSILENLEPPVPRAVFEAAVVWAGRKRPSGFWLSTGVTLSPQQLQSTLTRPFPLSNTPTRSHVPHGPSSLSEEDTVQMKKLRQLGMRSGDEARLRDMRQHIFKVADARARLPTPNPTLEAANLLDKSDVSLQDFGVPLHNIILKNSSASDPLQRFNSVVGSSSRSNRGAAMVSRRALVETQLPGSSADTETPSGRLESPIVSDLRRHLVPWNVSPSACSPNAEARGNLLRTSPGSSSSVDLQALGGLLETSGATTTKPILESKNPGPTSKGFEISRVNAATARHTTSAFGMLDHDVRPRSSHTFSQEFIPAGGSQTTDQASHESLHPAFRLSGLPHQRFSSTYEGHDANIRYLLERIFLDSYREPLPEFGVVVASGIPRRKAFRSYYSPRDRLGVSGNGTLIGNLAEHTAAISSIAVSPDFVFFVTSSHDGSVKVWDSVRLEKNVTSKSRHTFQQGGRVTCVCMLEHSHCFASASTNGTLCINRVDVNFESSLPTYGKLELIRQLQLDADTYITCMAHFNSVTSSDLIYTTNRCSILNLDLRTMRVSQALENPKHLGPPTCVCVDKRRTWLVVGTTRGFLSLWDLRFGLLLRTWSVADGPVHQLQVHPTQGKGRWILVTALCPLDKKNPPSTHQVVQVWDLEGNEAVQAFVVSSTHYDAAVEQVQARTPQNGDVLDSPNAFEGRENLADMTAAKAIERLLRGDSKDSEPPTIESLASLSLSRGAKTPTVYCFAIGSHYFDNSSSSGELITLADELNPTQSTPRPAGYLITAGEDRKIRFWDLSNPQRSSVVCGLELEEERPHFKLNASAVPCIHVEYHAKHFTTGRTNKNSTGAPSQVNSTAAPHRSTIVANYQQTILRNHPDAITAIAVMDLPYRCIVSGDRTGIVHVYEHRDKNGSSPAGR